MERNWIEVGKDKEIQGKGGWRHRTQGAKSEVVKCALRERYKKRHKVQIC